MDSPRGSGGGPLIKKLSGLYRIYREAKEQAFEETVQAVEGYSLSLLGVFLLAFLLFLWVGAATTPISIEVIYEAYGLMPATVIFAVSYFSFFLTSRLIFKPTAEELNDDTSKFALFSACSRRSSRSLLSVELAVLHTLAFTVFLLTRDPKFMEVI